MADRLVGVEEEGEVFSLTVARPLTCNFGAIGLVEGIVSGVPRVVQSMAQLVASMAMVDRTRSTRAVRKGRLAAPFWLSERIDMTAVMNDMMRI